MRDVCTISDYQENLAGVGRAIPAMLEVFSDHGIHVTWATVGFIFHKNVNELRKEFPTCLPRYEQKNLSPYEYISGTENLELPYHFAPQLIKKISEYSGHEVASHTYSHYYCLESGQTKENFRSDIAAAVKVASENGFSIRSLVFPRNQWNPDYLSMLSEFGIQCFRGNPNSWLYKSTTLEKQSFFQRLVQLIDCYLNLTGHHTHHVERSLNGAPVNIRASRFLRPHLPLLSVLDGLRLRRITRAMDDAAKHNRVFHLWWHPHNFGLHTDKNIAFLKRIAAHFLKLQSEYGMRSLNMGEIAESVHARP